MILPGDLVNLRGATVDEVFQHVIHLAGLKAEMQEALAGGNHAIPTVASVTAQLNSPAPAAPAPSGSPSGVPGVSCPHGQMTRRTGNSARGPWTGYFCPLAKGSPDQCKPRFQD